MKEKFLQFFTGKLSKSIYIAVASAVVCGVAVITTVVVVHNNNQKLDTALESLNEQTATMTQTESTTEGVSVTEGNDTTAPVQAANNEPAGDRALEYLAEYDRITEEYEKKKAEIGESSALQGYNIQHLGPKPVREIFYDRSPAMSDEDVAKIQAELDAEYESRVAAWEEESIAVSRNNEIEEKKMEEDRARSEEKARQLEQLQAQYEADIAALKAQYGIA